jgi:hypothetical protein
MKRSAALSILFLATLGLWGFSTPVAALSPASSLSGIEAAEPHNEFWANLQALCESAAEGELLQSPDDQIDPDARLVVHFWECGDEELRFPLHVDENRSRTWVIIHRGDHLELRHDHRNPDGSEESNTWYGSTTLEAGTANRQEFVTQRGEDTGGWAIEIEPGVHFTYGTIRNSEWRHHLRFDLANPVDLPPMHWGHETRPSQRPDPTGS